MGLFAYALDLPEDFFFDKLDRNMSALRVICYPEQTVPPEPGQLRSGAHTDYGTLTILMSDKAAGGLQALHRDGYSGRRQDRAWHLRDQYRRHHADLDQRPLGLDHAPRRQPASRARRYVAPALSRRRASNTKRRRLSDC